MKHIIQKHTGSHTTMNKELFSELIAKRFTVKDLSELDNNVNYRTINYWDEKGYLLSETDSEGWRRFCFGDYVWIMLLNELRDFDVAVKNIIPSLFIDFGFPYDAFEEMSEAEVSELRKMDFEKLLKKIDKEYALETFCRMLVNIISYRTPLTLRFFKDGSSLPIYGNPAFHGIRLKPALDDYYRALSDSNFCSSISISVDSLIKNFIEKKELNNIAELQILTLQEIEILRQLENNQLKEVTIFFEDGKPERFEIVERLKNFDVTKRVKEGFFSNYQSCTYITTKGETFTLERRTSKFLKNRK